MGLDANLYLVNQSVTQAWVDSHPWEAAAPKKDVMEWKNFYELDGVFGRLWHKRTTKLNKPFTRELLVVTKEDLISIIQSKEPDVWDDEYEDEDWKMTYHCFQVLLNVLDFETQTLLYDSTN